MGELWYGIVIAWDRINGDEEEILWLLPPHAALKLSTEDAQAEVLPDISIKLRTCTNNAIHCLRTHTLAHTCVRKIKKPLGFMSAQFGCFQSIEGWVRRGTWASGRVVLSP